MTRLEVIKQVQCKIDEGMTLERYIREVMGVPPALVGAMVTQMVFALELKQAAVTNPSVYVSGNVPTEVQRSTLALQGAGVTGVPSLIVEEDEHGKYIASLPYLLPSNSGDFALHRAALLIEYSKLSVQVDQVEGGGLLDRLARGLNAWVDGFKE